MLRIVAFLASRALDIALRGVHLAAMALLVGGLAVGATFERVEVAFHVTMVSGLLMTVSGLLSGRMAMTQGAGVAVLVKLLLLGLAWWLPAQRLPWLLAATFIASVGAHMPGTWRHFSFVVWRVVPKPKRPH
jgi:hypothetical protein